MNELMNDNIQYDHLIDNKVASLSQCAQDKTIVFDSRMAWKFAKDSFKVYLTIDPLEAANRVISTRNNLVEAYSNISEAKDMLIRRANIENERFKKIYDVDNFDYRNYNLVLDTTYISADQVCDIIYQCFLDFLEEHGSYETRILLSPKVLYPTISLNSINNNYDDETIDIDKQQGIIFISVYDGYNYIVSGHKYWLSAIVEERTLLEVTLVNFDEDSLCISYDDFTKKINDINRNHLEEFEKIGNFKYLSYPFMA